MIWDACGTNSLAGAQWTPQMIIGIWDNLELDLAFLFQYFSVLSLIMGKYCLFVCFHKSEVAKTIRDAAGV